MPDINMQVFEEAQRNQLVTEFDIQTQIALDDYQIRLSDIANPTQSQDNAVIDRHGEFLPHWNESLDFDTWVKMSMEASGKRGLLIHGNDGLSSRSNGDDTFISFDNEESDNSGDWSLYSGDASVSQSSVQSYDGDYSLRLDGVYTGVNHIFTKTPQFLNGDYICDGWAYITDVGTYGVVGIGFFGVSESSYIHIVAEQNKIKTYYDGAIIEYTRTINYNTWYYLKVKKIGNTMYYHWNGEDFASQTITESNYNTINMRLNGNRDDVNYYDVLKIRKYTATEPTYTIGTPKNIIALLKSFGRAG